MSDLIKRLRALRQDLQKHLTVGALAAFVVTLAVTPQAQGVVLAHEWFLAALIGAVAGFVSAAALGWAKEYLWDARGRGTVDRLDYLTTGRGGGLGAAAGLLVVVALHLAGVPPWGLP